jgi:hypothetical protein
MSATSPPLAARGRGRDTGYGIFFPVLIILVSLMLWFGFQTYQLITERGSLGELKTRQETTLHNARKMRVQLDVLARGTARLARQGNPNAKRIVAGLRARGVVINAAASTGQTPAGR